MDRARAVVPTALLGLSALLAGCGDEAPGLQPDQDAGKGLVAATPQALAAIVVEHVPDAKVAWRHLAMGDLPKESIGADVRYADDVGINVIVAPGAGEQPLGCDVSECEELDTGVEGATARLVWQEEEPEEDPGVIYVVLEVDGQTISVEEGGNVLVTADPREMDLPVSVDELLAVAEDPLLRLETTRAAVRAGEKLEIWSKPDY